MNAVVVEHAVLDLEKAIRNLAEAWLNPATRPYVENCRQDVLRAVALLPIPELQHYLRVIVTPEVERAMLRAQLEVSAMSAQ